jgi:FlaG/FlaF family flagellin (archaellin)
MLMVVVTVILAAAVSSNSLGFMKGSDPAPYAVFDVQIKKDVDVGGSIISFMEIKQVTGETIDTKELKITTFYAEGAAPLTEVFPSNSTVPSWNNPAANETEFGDYVLKPGRVMIAQSDVDDGMEKMVTDWDEVDSGDFITVTLVHIPTGKVIFEADVEVV